MREKYSVLKNEVMRQDIYYELTPTGVGLCIVMGLIAELLVLFIFGIQLAYVPLAVFGFLWVLFGILISGVLIGLEMVTGIALGEGYTPQETIHAKYRESKDCAGRWHTDCEHDLRKAS